MKFKRLTIQNFLSIKQVTLDLENQGLVLLKGRNLDNESLNNNGAGKSSIIEALIYALYGRTIRGLKGDSVVHKIPKKNMKIFLDLEDDDGTEYRIARYRKHSTNKNKSLLYMNGRDITPKSEADFNSAVADLLQADYLTFTSSLLYSAESFKFTSATDSEMKSTFDTMLGLDIYQKCLELTKVRLNEVSSAIQTTQDKIEDRKSRITQLEQQINEAKEDKKEYDKSIAEKEQELKDRILEATDQLKQDQEALDNLDSQLEKAERNKDKAEKALASKRKMLREVDELKVALQEVQDDIQSHERTVRKNKNVITDCRESLESYSQSIEDLREQISNCEAKKAELDEEVGQPCPTCGQPLTKESLSAAKQEYDDKIGKHKASIEKYLGKIESTNNDIEAAQETIKSAQDEISELQETVDEFTLLIKKSKKLVDEKEQAEEEVQKAQEKFYKIQSKQETLRSSVKRAQKVLKQFQSDLDGLSNKNPYDDLITKYTNEQEKCDKEVTELQDSIQDQLDEQTCLEFWKQAYSNQGIKSFILDDITPFLNRRANKYLAKLTSGHIEVKFNTQTTLKSGETREKFSIDIVNQDGGQEYSANSGGEKKRIDLAINLAMQDLVASRSNKKMNIAIFDEAFDALDEVGVEKVIELLQDLSEEKSSIFVISHNEHLQSYFTNVVTVVKQNGFSTIGTGEIEAEQEEMSD